MNQDKWCVIAKALVHNRLSPAFPPWDAACFRMCKTRLECLALLPSNTGAAIKKHPRALSVEGHGLLRCWSVTWKIK